MAIDEFAVHLLKPLETVPLKNTVLVIFYLLLTKKIVHKAARKVSKHCCYRGVVILTLCNAKEVEIVRIHSRHIVHSMLSWFGSINPSLVSSVNSIKLYCLINLLFHNAKNNL